MTEERWRCFVAVPLGEDVRGALALAAERWEAAADLRWSTPESWHITVAFLGPVAVSALPGLRGTIAEVARDHQPMRLSAGGLGAFPSPARARVVWYGIDDRTGGLAAVARDLAAALGLDAPAPFRAHVTLARARRGSADLREWLSANSGSAPALWLDVRHLELMRSHLGRAAARYETLAAMDLGGSAHA